MMVAAAVAAVAAAVHFFFGFEAWTYPWIAPLFWIYQSTDSGDNKLC